MSITTLNDWNGVSLRVTTHDDAKKELDRCVIVYARDEEDALNVARNNGFNPTYKKHCSKSLVMQMKKRFVYIDKDYWETDEPIRLCDPFKFLHDALDILKTIKEREPSKDPEDDSCGINCFYKSLTWNKKESSALKKQKELNCVVLLKSYQSNKGENYLIGITLHITVKGMTIIKLT